jgi:hypothetical protein
MSVLTLRIPDEKHERLRRLAGSRGMSMNRLVDEWATVALTQFDAETRFRTLAAQGSATRGLTLLDRADAAERRTRKPCERVPGGEGTSLPLAARKFRPAVQKLCRNRRD